MTMFYAWKTHTHTQLIWKICFTIYYFLLRNWKRISRMFLKLDQTVQWLWIIVHNTSVFKTFKKYIFNIWFVLPFLRHTFIIHLIKSLKLFKLGYILLSLYARLEIKWNEIYGCHKHLIYIITLISKRPNHLSTGQKVSRHFF